jgi:ketopantoate reductase
MPISIVSVSAARQKSASTRRSMLQDLEAGRPMELEAVVGAVWNWENAWEFPCPTWRVYACTRLLGIISFLCKVHCEESLVSP